MHSISKASTPKIPAQEPELAPEREPSKIPLYELVAGPSCFRRYTYELVAAPYDLTKPVWSASRPKPILVDLVGEAAQIPCAASATPSLSIGRAPPGSNRIVSQEYVRVPSISNIPPFEYVRAPTTTTHRPAVGVGQALASANSKRATMEPAYAPTTSRRQAYENVNVQAPSTSRSNVVHPTNEPSSTQRRIQITFPAHKADPITGERSVVYKSALGQRCKQCGKRSILNFSQCFHNDRAFARVHRLQCMHVSSSVRRRSNHPKTVQVGSLQYSDISSSEGPDLGESEDEAPVREIETHEISDSDDE